MNASAHAAIVRAEIEHLTPGMPFGGGFFVGILNEGDHQKVLIRAPKATGQLLAAWNDSSKFVEGAMSYIDGRANTLAMAAADSKLAEQILALQIDGFSDWYLPAMDELELMYRTLKPSTEENYLYGRSGVNASAVPPTQAYSADAPAQTDMPVFKVGAAEAFDEAWYWSSTQHAGHPGYAWMQDFDGGSQYYGLKSSQYRAVAVRSLIIQ